MPTFIAFIDKEKAKELGISLERIVAPHDVLSKSELGVLFPVHGKRAERDALFNSAEFRAYAENPRYYKTVVCGN